MEVEEAIELLKEYISIWKDKKYWDDNKPHFGLGHIQAIETVLKDRERLIEENKQLKELLKESD